jgi:hypothetical protein
VAWSGAELLDIEGASDASVMDALNAVGVAAESTGVECVVFSNPGPKMVIVLQLNPACGTDISCCE